MKTVEIMKMYGDLVRDNTSLKHRVSELKETMRDLSLKLDNSMTSSELKEALYLSSDGISVFSKDGKADKLIEILEGK